MLMELIDPQVTSEHALVFTLISPQLGFSDRETSSGDCSEVCKAFTLLLSREEERTTKDGGHALHPGADQQIFVNLLWEGAG